MFKIILIQKYEFNNIYIYIYIYSSGFDISFSSLYFVFCILCLKIRTLPTIKPVPNHGMQASSSLSTKYMFKK